MEKDLEKILNKRFSSTYKVSKRLAKDTNLSHSSRLDKKTFVKIVSLLENVEEANQELFDIGIDVSMHESRFFEIIDLLLSKFLTKLQLAYLQVYLYGNEFLEDVPVLTNEKGEHISPETPEELWIALNKLK